MRYLHIIDAADGSRFATDGELAFVEGDFAPPGQRDLQLTVDPAAEADLTGRAEGQRGRSLLFLAEADELLDVLGRVPRALRPVGEDQH